MRILMISTLYPPFVQGGAEICAYNLATWAAAHGHEVAVLTTAPTPADELWDVEQDGCRMFRVSIPRGYTIFETGVAGRRKPLWHLQDHVDPRNATIVDRVVRAVSPDVVSVQYIQGIGYNALKVLGRHDLPVVFTLHDLGLACFRMAMFVDGKECAGQCVACKASGFLKRGYLRSIRRLAFISPSTANLDKLRSLQPIDRYPLHRVLNANRYPVPTRPRTAADHLRLVYVGRLHESKGVDVVLAALDGLAARGGFTLDVLGTGPSETKWREAYADRPWLRFHGQVPLETVAETMNDSDLLLVPSIWLENSPGVVIQALSLGLPVAGSAKGGIPELVHDGVNGLLVPPGDVAAWRAALTRVLDEPALLTSMRASAEAAAGDFGQDRLAEQALAVFEATRTMTPVA